MTRPVSNPSALQRPGMLQNDVSGSFNNRAGQPRGFAPLPFQNNKPTRIAPADFDIEPSFVGKGISHPNGEVPKKTFNGQAIGRADPDFKNRYAAAKKLREFQGF